MKQNKCCKDVRKQIRKLESLKEEGFIKLIEDIESEMSTYYIINTTSVQYISSCKYRLIDKQIIKSNIKVSK